MTFGDIIAQSIEKQRDENVTDWKRAARMGLVGFTLHGPYFYFAFSQIERFIGPAISLNTAMQKTAISQFVAFPPYLALLFTYLSVLKGETDLKILSSETKRKAADAFIVGCFFWPVANMFGFMYISNKFRVPYLAGVGIIWNTFISMCNQRK